MRTLLLLVCTLFVGATYAQVYVDADATGSNDGSSWANAYTSLHDAVITAEDNDQLWIAAGTYYPLPPTENPDTSLYIAANIQLYGGFAGTEATLDERNPSANRVIISGDQNGDDLGGDINANSEDNNRHVFFVRDGLERVVFDGLIIRNGKSQGVEGAGNTRRAGGILLYSPCTIRSCSFINNFGYFGGAVYPRIGGADGTIIEDCLFLENQAQFGGGIYMNAPSSTVSNCEFTSNRAQANGAGIFDSSSEGSMIVDCEFADNQTAEGRGAGVYLGDTQGTVMSCTFENNVAIASSGAAIQVRTDDDEAVFLTNNIINCTFDLHTATFGGAIGVYDSLSIANITGCTFNDNRSDNVGGAISNAFGGTTNVTDCVFENNESGSGGAIFLQNDEGEVNITGSTFNANVARNFGGALNISGTGAVGDNVTLSKLTLTNSIVEENSATTQGGGINLNAVNADIVSTLIVNNFTDEGLTVGGGISINSGDTTQVYVSITNSTIADNYGSFLAGIAHFTGEIDGFSELTLQNTILANDIGGDNYTVEGGTPTLISNGGNMSSDDTTEDAFTAMNDALGEDPDFEGGSSYALAVGSPAINTGVSSGAPATDILGNPRVGTVDKGAYENQIISDVEDVIASAALHLYPNPTVSETLFVAMGEAFDEEVSVRIVDLQGQLMQTTTLTKTEDLQTARLNVSGLPAGYYILSADDGSGQGSKRFIKAE